MALRQPTNGHLSSGLENEFRDPEFRHEFMAEHIRSGIAYQIRAMRDARRWNQKKLATKAGKPQSVMSRLEDPDYGKVSIQTLIGLAKAFDVALLVRFVGFGEFLIRTADLSPDALNAPEFNDDPLVGHAKEGSGGALIPVPVQGGLQLGSVFDQQLHKEQVPRRTAPHTASIPTFFVPVERFPIETDHTGIRLS